MTSRGLLGPLGLLFVAVLIGAGAWLWFDKSDEGDSLGLEDDPLTESAHEEDGPQLSADGRPVAPPQGKKAGELEFQGKSVPLEGGCQCRVEDGQITVAWNYWDFLGAMASMGAIAPDAFARACGQERFEVRSGPAMRS